MESIGNNIIVRDGWLNGHTKSIEFGNGETLGEIANNTIPIVLADFVRCQVNGVELDDWRDVIPAEGNHYLVYVLPQGESGKETLGYIAAIAVSAVGGAAIPGIAGLIGTGAVATGIATGIYMVGSSLILNAIQKSLFKPPDQPSYDYGAGSNPFFSFTGTSNRYEPWGTVSRIYGRIRVAPKLFQKPLTFVVGKTEYIRMGFDFGYGPLLLSDFKIGETLLSSYTGVKTSYHPTFIKGDTLDFFDSDYEIDQVNVTLPYDNTIVPSTTPEDTYKVSIDFFAPQGMYSVNNSTGQRRNLARNLNIYIREIVGGVPGQWTQASFFGSISNSLYTVPESSPLISAQKRTLINLDVWYANGVWNLGLINGRSFLQFYYPLDPIGGTIVDFWPPVGWSEYMYDAEGQMTPGTPYIITAHDKPNRIITTTYTGQQAIFRTFASYNEIPLQKTHQVFVGGETSDTPENIGHQISVNNTLSDYDPFPYSVLIDFYKPGQYEIGVQDAGNQEPSGDPNAPYTYVNRVDFIKTVSYTNAGESILQPEVPHTILEIEMPATDQLNGNIQEFNCIAHSLLPRWDGSAWINPPTWNDTTNQWSFTPVATRNPAWIYLDILRGNTNKNPVADSKIDLSEFLAWAQDNDAIPVNDPNAPAGYVCDMIIDGETTVKEALKNVASVGRATPGRRDAKFSIVRDSPNKIPVQLISPKNCISFSAEMSYTKLPHALKVSFLDESDGFLNKEVIVYSAGYNANGSGGNAVATQFETLSLPGTTRIEQARRLARYYMATAQLQRERINCSLDYEQLIVQRGDLCLVASGNDTLQAGGIPVRVMKIEGSLATGFVLTLDEPIASLSAIRYRGTDEVILVTQVSNNQIQLPINQAAPPLYDLIEYGASESTKATFIVEDITPGGDFSASLRLVEYRPEIQQAVDTDIIPPRVTRPGSNNDFKTGPVTNLSVTSNPYYNEGYQYTRFDLFWLPPRPGYADYYNVYVFRGELPQYIGKTSELNYVGVNVVNISQLRETAKYTFGVEPVINRVGVGPMATVTFNLAPDTDPPTDVVNFGCNAQTGTLYLYWDRATDPDIHHFEIRYSPDTLVEWPNSTLLVDNIPPTLTEFTVPLRPGLYLIKAVDGAGNFSENAASTVVQVSDLEYVSEYLVLNFLPFSSGNYDNVELRPGLDELILAQDANVGYYTPPTNEGIHFVELTKTRLYAAIELELIAFDELLNSPWFDPMNTAVPISPSGLLTSNIVDASIQFRYRTQSTDEYSVWYNLFVADVTAIDIEFRIKLQTREPGYTPTVRFAAVKADWLERTETGQDVSIPAGGLNIVFDFEFMQRPSIGITLENAAIGDYYQLTNVTMTGFTIQVFNSSGVGKAGQIDWIAKGYGKAYPGGVSALNTRFI